MEKSGLGADSRRNNVIALILMLMVFAALGLRLWASAQMNRLNGPQQITVLEGDLLISVGDSVLRTTPDGVIRGEYPLHALGMPEALTEMQALADGSVLLAASQPSLLRRCRLDPLSCETLAEASLLPWGHAYKLAFDLEGDRLFISDSEAHRLLLADDPRHLDPQPLTLDERPRFPNNLHLDSAHGLLWVADTNHHRLAAYRIDGREGRLVGSIATGAHPMARRGRIWPTAFAFDDAGMAWVLNGNNGLVDADLLGFQPDGTPLARAALPDDADPAFIVHLGGELFVTDLRRVTVHRIALQDMSVSELGGAFGARIAERRAERGHYAALSQAGLWSLVAVVVLGFIVAGMSLKDRVAPRGNAAAPGRQPRPLTPGRPASLVPAEHFPGVDWIEPDTRAMRQLRQMMRVAVIGLTIIVVVPIVLWVVGDRDGWIQEQEMRAMLAMPFVLALSMAPLFWLSWRAFQARLGVRGGLLYLRDHRGRAMQIPPEVAVCTRKAVAHGPITVMLANGLGDPLYRPDIHRTRIQPLLERAQFLGPIHFALYQIMQRQPQAVAGIVLPLAGFAALYVLYRWF